MCELDCCCWWWWFLRVAIFTICVFVQNSNGLVSKSFAAHFFSTYMLTSKYLCVQCDKHRCCVLVHSSPRS